MKGNMWEICVLGLNLRVNMAVPRHSVGNNLEDCSTLRAARLMKIANIAYYADVIGWKWGFVAAFQPSISRKFLFTTEISQSEYQLYFWLSRIYFEKNSTKKSTFSGELYHLTVTLYWTLYWQTSGHCPSAIIRTDTYVQSISQCKWQYRVGQKKTGPFLRVYNFATVVARNACDMSKFSKFYPEKNIKLACQCV